MISYGYKASAEQFGPRELLRFARGARAAGLDTIVISDHFQPWRHTDGHSPSALAWLAALGEAVPDVRIGTSVLTPTLRYHPSIVAQAFGTLACLYPGRVFLGVGTGEAMNEIPATGAPWPSIKERRRRLAEAIALMRRLWTEERVDFDGEYYTTVRATVYDRPSEPIPIYVAAAGPLIAKLAGRVAEGVICTSGKDPALYERVCDSAGEGAAAAGRTEAMARQIEIKLSYDHDVEYARRACGWWAALGLTPEEKQGVDDPLEMERLADAAADRAHRRFIVSDDPQDVADRIAPYVEAGFTELMFHAPGADQERFLEQFGRDVLPLLARRFGPSDIVPTFAAQTA
jgi:coenzyme F420-dependent glucose-6-phosphate dehydrogenase